MHSVCPTLCRVMPYSVESDVGFTGMFEAKRGFVCIADALSSLAMCLSGLAGECARVWGVRGERCGVHRHV